MLLQHLRRALNLHLSVNQDRQVNRLYGQAMAHLMVGAIVLTHRQRSDTRGQNVSRQNARRPDEATFNVKPEIGKGVQL